MFDICCVSYTFKILFWNLIIRLLFDLEDISKGVLVPIFAKKDCRPLESTTMPQKLFLSILVAH